MAVASTPAVHAGGFGVVAACLHHHFAEISPEEKLRLRFWADYYQALRQHYGMEEEINWVAYYKSHGYTLDPSTQGMRYVPVKRERRWRLPSSSLSGSPSAPAYQINLPVPVLGMGDQ